jgi:superoxide dismutase, Fe-Mn family
MGLLLWALVMGALVATQGWQGTLATMAWFFTKAALLTFGGAYAVLPYVYQGAVEQHHWLSGAQMIDGLALGETTPGPLIMVVAFVGFVGGWAKQVLGPDALFAGAALAASVVTFFTSLRPAGRGHARQARIHRAAVGDHCGRRRRDPESGLVLRLSRALAAGPRRNFRVAIGPDRAGRGTGPLSLQGRRDSPAGGLCCRRPGRDLVAPCAALKEMNVQAQALPFDPATLRGLSAKLLASHHQNNYGGAVTRLNALRTQLAATRPASAPGFVLNGLKREELIATNSMLLHELYFASLGSDGKTMVPAMALALAASFGSVERWREEFVAMGKAQGGGSGWVLLVFQPREGSLVNQWAADHTHALAGGVPILALDMYEHAYHLDYGAAAGAYVDAFMDNLDWAPIYERYQHAVHAASEAAGATREQIGNALLLDVRRAGVYEQAANMIPGARWRDPAAVADWAAELPPGREVIVYCVYGHEVGRSTALRLRAAGVNARYLRGGIDAWQAAGQPLEAKETSS